MSPACRTVGLAVALAVAPAGCRGGPPPASGPARSSAAAEAGDRDAPPTLPSPPAPAAEPAESPRVDLTFRAQPGWFEERPESSMRLAQYRLPRATGDPADAHLVVYYFGPGGGSVAANLERWIGQFEQPDGTDSAAVAWTREIEVAGRKAWDLDVSGTYVAETAPGSGRRLHEPGWRLRATIVPTPAGRCYLKLVGPERTVAVWAESYDRFLDSLGETEE